MDATHERGGKCVENVLLAFGLTALAGLSTGIGSALALLTKKTNTKFLSVSLGFSAGVMIYVSMVEIFFKARTTLAAELGERLGSWVTVGAFFAGILLIAVIDNVLPNTENPHEIHRVEEMDENKGARESKLLRTGASSPRWQSRCTTSLKGSPHSSRRVVSRRSPYPSSWQSPWATFREGFGVAVPVYYATGSRKKAFLYSFIGPGRTGGRPRRVSHTDAHNERYEHARFSPAIAVNMVFISLDELLPAAREYGEHHLSIYGLIAGMAIMAVSLLLFV